MINPPPIHDDHGSFSWQSWYQQVYQNATPLQGPTAGRPTKNLNVGLRYFDTDLGKPVFYKGPGWVDATGASA